MAKLTRYKKNIGKFGIDEEIQEKIFSSKVAIVGAGDLGSGVIMNLAALGVGQIKIIDDEVVKEEDLNVQLIHKCKNIGRSRVMSAKDWVNEYNTDVKVDLFKIKLNELNYFNIIEDYEIIIDCSNSVEMKYILNEIALRHNKILIHGYTQGFYGQVTTVVPKRSACLECLKQKPSVIKEPVYPSVAPIVNMIASLESQEFVKIMTGGCELLTEKLLMFDGYKSTFKIYNYAQNPVCRACGNIN